MKLAFLGADSATLALARAVVARADCQAVWLCDLGPDCGDAANAVREVLRGVRPTDDWESLLDTRLVDAVVVARGGDQERRADQLRKLVQAGVPLVVAHPVVDSMLVYYELDMIRRETGCVMLPYLPDRWHPAIGRLAALVHEGAGSAIGLSEQLVMERRLADRSKPRVLAQFARDIDLIRSIAGELTRIGAMSAVGAEAAYGNLGIQMSGPGGTLARWSVQPAETAAEAGTVARLSLLGATGKAVVNLSADGRPWTLELSAGGQTQVTSFDDWKPADMALDKLRQAIEAAKSTGRASGTQTTSGTPGAAIEPTWVDASRAVELAETIDRSLAKGRNIELYYEDYTEQGTFKGIMSSWGCGLLMAGLFVMALGALVGKFDLLYIHRWPYLLVGLLGVFLLMQLLTLVFKAEGARGKAEGGRRKAEEDRHEPSPRDRL